MAGIARLRAPIAAVIAALIAVVTLSQRRQADNRAEWWRRAQRALDASSSEEPRRAEIGQQSINLPGRSKLATPEDGVLLKIGTEGQVEAANAARLAEAANGASISDQVQAHLSTVDDQGTTRDNEADRNDRTGR